MNRKSSKSVSKSGSQVKKHDTCLAPSSLEGNKCLAQKSQESQFKLLNNKIFFTGSCFSPLHFLLENDLIGRKFQEFQFKLENDTLFLYTSFCSHPLIFTWTA